MARATFAREMNFGEIIIQRDIAMFRAFWPRSTSASTPARRYAFQCSDILDIWCRTIGQAQKVQPFFVAALNDSGAPLILLPLGMSRDKGLNILKFLDGGVSDLNAPILFPGAHDIDEASALKLWRQIQSQLPRHDLVMFEKMPAQIEDWHNPLRFLSTGPCRRGGHYSVTLSADWSEIKGSRLPSLSQSRRQLRKLSNFGEVSFVVSQNQEEALTFLSSMMEMKKAQYLKTLGRNRLLEAGWADYYTQASRRLFGAGSVHLSALKVDSEIVAAHWGYVVGDRFYQLMPAFKNVEKWRRYAPGKLLNEFLMEWAAENGLKVFDFGVGDEPYKAGYADRHEPLYDAVLPVTVAGKMCSLGRSVAINARSSVKGTHLEKTLKRTVHALRLLDSRIKGVG